MEKLSQRLQCLFKYLKEKRAEDWKESLTDIKNIQTIKIFQVQAEKEKKEDEKVRVISEIPVKTIYIYPDHSGKKEKMIEFFLGSGTFF